jgi:hypothetical protein
MRTKSLRLFVYVFITLIFLARCTPNNDQSNFTFVAACDMRYFAMEEYRSSEWTIGGFEAIKKYGQGEFMISPGDVEPPWATRELIDQVFGKDYLWYPGVGNHDLEDEKYMEYLRALNNDGNKLPNVVRLGPTGSEETTYSFDYGNSHFVNLNLYYDGKTDNGTDGDVVPELLEWLENDLKENELRESEIIQQYLPKPMSNEELSSISKSIVEEVGAKSMADMGKVMGIANKQLLGKADGKSIANKVRELLS